MRTRGVPSTGSSTTRSLAVDVGSVEGSGKCERFRRVRLSWIALPTLFAYVLAVNTVWAAQTGADGTRRRPGLGSFLLRVPTASAPDLPDGLPSLSRPVLVLEAAPEEAGAWLDARNGSAVGLIALLVLVAGVIVLGYLIFGNSDPGGPSRFG